MRAHARVCSHVCVRAHIYARPHAQKKTAGAALTGCVRCCARRRRRRICRAHTQKNKTEALRILLCLTFFGRSSGGAFSSAAALLLCRAARFLGLFFSSNRARPRARARAHPFCERRRRCCAHTHPFVPCTRAECKLYTHLTCFFGCQKLAAATFQRRRRGV